MFEIGLKKNPCHWNRGIKTIGPRGQLLGEVGETVWRVPVRGVVAGGVQMSVVVVASTMGDLERVPRDMIVHYHGGGATSFGKNNVSLKRPDMARFDGDDRVRVNDVHVNQIPQQVAASGKDVVVMIPQGPHRENFRFAAGVALWTALIDEGYFSTRELDRIFVSGHSAGGPLAVRRGWDAWGLFLFDPVKQSQHEIERLLKGRKKEEYEFYAAFNTSESGGYRGYSKYGKQLIKGIGKDWTVELVERASGVHAHHSMVSAGDESQDREIDGRAGYTREYVPGSGNFEKALRQCLGEGQEETIT